MEINYEKSRGSQMKSILIRYIRFDNLENRDAHNLSKYLSQEKVEKLNRFKVDADYNRSLYAEIIVKQFFATKFGLHHSKINIVYDRNGKPYVKNFPDVHFSISHSGDYVLVAFNKGPIGIDVEKSNDFDYKGIVDRYFENFEKNYIFKRSDDYFDKLQRFYQIWTAKESYTKLKGVGLSSGLDYFCVEDLSDKNMFILRDKVLSERYFVKSCEVDRNYILSVCCSDDNFDIFLEPLNILKVKSFFEIFDNYVELIHKDKTSSTNDDAKKMLKNINGNFILIADEQTKGRGRVKKNFYSPKDVGIYMTIVLRDFKESMPFLSMSVALSVLKTIKKISKNAYIKEPNDILLGGKKVCGILIESSVSTQKSIFEYVVIGIGLNVNNERFSPEIQDIATSVKLETGREIDKNILINIIILELGLLLKTPKDIVQKEYQDNLIKNYGDV